MRAISKKCRWGLLILVSMMQPVCKHQQPEGQQVYLQYLKANQVQAVSKIYKVHDQHKKH